MSLPIFWRLNPRNLCVFISPFFVFSSTSLEGYNKKVVDVLPKPRMIVQKSLWIISQKILKKFNLSWKISLLAFIKLTIVDTRRTDSIGRQRNTLSASSCLSVRALGHFTTSFYSLAFIRILAVTQPTLKDINYSLIHIACGQFYIVPLTPGIGCISSHRAFSAESQSWVPSPHSFIFSQFGPDFW